MSLRTEFSLSLFFLLLSFPLFFFILLSAFLPIEKRPRVVTDYPGSRWKVALMECKKQTRKCFLHSKTLFSFILLPSTGRLTRCVSASPTQTYNVTKQSINKCWSRQERTQEVFMWSACTMTFSQTGERFKLLLYCILPLTTTLCHWVRKGSMDIPHTEEKKLPVPRHGVSNMHD